MSRDAVLAVVEAHLSAFNARDADLVAALFADDATMAAGDQLVVGRRGLHAAFADSFAGPLHPTLELRRAVVEGDTAACELAQHLPGATLEVAAFFTVRDGELVRLRIYRET